MGALKSDINISDIIYMRDVEKLSQRQIADRLGTCQSNISRLIGNRSETRTRKRERGEIVSSRATCLTTKPVETPKPSNFGIECAKYIEQLAEQKNAPAATPAPSYSPVYKMDVIQSVLKLKGTMCNYIIDTVKNEIELSDGVLTGLLDKASIPGLIAELQEIQARLSN